MKTGSDRAPSDISRLSSSTGPVVVITGVSNLARRIVYRYKERLPPGSLFVVEEHPKSLDHFVKFARRRIRARGILSLADALAARLLQAALHRRTFADQESRAVEPSLVVEDVGDPAIARFVADTGARLVILNLCSVIPAAQLAAISLPVINVHPGINPRYRGAGNIWALSEGRMDLVGATIHYVDAGIDTGAAIAFVQIDPVADQLGVEDCVVTAQMAGAELAADVVTGREVSTVHQLDFLALESRFYPYPGLSTWLQAWWRLSRAQQKSRRNRLKGVKRAT